MTPPTDFFTLSMRISTLLIVGGFMPLSVVSFFKFMVVKKENDFNNAKCQMGINSSRSVWDTFTPSKYLLPVLFATVICSLGAATIAFAEDFKSNLHDNILLSGAYFGSEQVPRELILQSLSVFCYSFLASFLWSAGNIILRIRNTDLQPGVYYNVGLRVIFAGMVSIALSFMLGGDQGTGIPFLKSSLPAIAIVAGTFPDSILSFFVRKYKDYVNPETINSEVLALNRIEGISMNHQDRLEEIGIDNAQNLASASLTKLMVDTPYDARLLIDWISQAKLLCYAKENIDGFRKVGIRSVFDLLSDDKSPEILQKLADAAAIPSVILENIHAQVNAETGIQSLFTFYSRLNAPSTWNNNPAEIPMPSLLPTA